MSIIEELPEAMLTEHIAWHSQPGNPVSGGRTVNPFPPIGATPAEGSGEEFLVWHEGFIQRFHDWVTTLPLARQAELQPQLEPWTAIPIMLKMSSLGWNVGYADEERQLTNMRNFQSSDDLGVFLEWSLHGFLHSAASAMNSEPVLLSFRSPASTFFWQLHGLIDHYRQTWINSQEQAAPVDISQLTLNGGSVQTNIGTPGEVDRFSFSIPSDGDYTLETSGSSNTVLFIGGPGNIMNLHSQDDDGGQNFNSKIEGTFTEGEYMAYVILYNSDKTGNYGITFRN
ncbi:hypothetical protein MNBD_GAMMA12-163 [hydrothermal vent metagenome]|uniref:Peptidase C-terminal archaeal/bacterial domain-containing protein n=1 Tax=hydrothermal vent metagenome TaxID=652676 RepID=A0A3B0Y199_9ZZZZ